MESLRAHKLQNIMFLRYTTLMLIGLALAGCNLSTDGARIPTQIVLPSLRPSATAIVAQYVPPATEQIYTLFTATPQQRLIVIQADTSTRPTLEIIASPPPAATVTDTQTLQPTPELVICGGEPPDNLPDYILTGNSTADTMGSLDTMTNQTFNTALTNYSNIINAIYTHLDPSNAFNPANINVMIGGNTIENILQMRNGSTATTPFSFLCVDENGRINLRANTIAFFSSEARILYPELIVEEIIQMRLHQENLQNFNAGLFAPFGIYTAEDYVMRHTSSNERFLEELKQHAWLELYTDGDWDGLNMSKYALQVNNIEYKTATGALINLTETINAILGKNYSITEMLFMITKAEYAIDLDYQLYLKTGGFRVADFIGGKRTTNHFNVAARATRDLAMANIAVEQAASSTADKTATQTPTATITPTSTATASHTPTLTSTNTATATLPETQTVTHTATTTLTNTYTPTLTPTATVTASETSTLTTTPTATASNTFTPSFTPSATPTSTPEPSVTDTQSAVAEVLVTPADETEPITNTHGNPWKMIGEVLIGLGGTLMAAGIALRKHAPSKPKKSAPPIVAPQKKPGSRKRSSKI